MSFYSLLKLNPTPSMLDIEDSFDGNLCRCTGYRPILDSAKSFSSEASTCQEASSCSESKCRPTKLVDFAECKPYDPTLDIPFPEHLLLQASKPGFVMNRGGLTWLAPTTLSELLHAKSLFPSAKLIGGNSDVSIEMKFRAANYSTFINVASIRDLNTLGIVEKNSLEIGASVTIASLIDSLRDLKHEPFQRTLVNALLANLRTFATRQIRNFATIGGNVITGWSMSDLSPILLANNASVTVLSEKSGIRTVPIREFYVSGKADLKSDEVLLKLNIQLPSSDLEIVKAYKQYKRKEVNACFRVCLEKSGRISSLDLAFGGLAPSAILLQDVGGGIASLRERVWGEEETLTAIQDNLLSKINLAYSAEGGMATFRRTLAVSFFTRFWHQTAREASLENVGEICKGLSAGVQDVGTCDDSEDKNIGTVTHHVSGLNQATGTAKYLDDMPPLSGELHVGFVLSQRAHALIKSVDASKALALQGVHDFISHKDVINQADNMFGFMKDEEIFASKEVHFHGKTRILMSHINFTNDCS